MDGYRRDRTLLDGVRILEMSEGIAGASAGALLASLGADVRLAAGPDGHPLERRAPLTASGRSVYDLAFNRTKRRVSIRPGAGATDPFDVDAVILEGDAGRVSDLLTRVSTPVVAITPFGLSGPRKDWKGSELVAQAYAGIV
jgi:crotonobetainyl-CoA:carnitine CoA-transferase CaiB-like acyl-CoA transferase